MAESSRSHQLLSWALGTFHAGFFVLVLVVMLYCGGNLADILGGLSTLLGLGIFGLLWAVAWWSTRRALQGIEQPLHVADPGELVGLGSVWGGVAGVLFLFGLAALLLLVGILGGIAALAATGQDPGLILPTLAGFLLGGAVALAVGSLVAFVLGVIVGTIFALLDTAILLACRFLLRLCTEPPVGL